MQKKEQQTVKSNLKKEKIMILDETKNYGRDDQYFSENDRELENSDRKNYGQDNNRDFSNEADYENKDDLDANDQEREEKEDFDDEDDDLDSIDDDDDDELESDNEKTKSDINKSL